MPETRKTRFFYLTGKTAWIAFVLSLAATLWAWQVTREATLERERLRFDFRVKETENAIFKQLQSYEQVLRGVVGLFAASTRVERDEFKGYVASIKIHEHYRGIQAIGYLELIPATQKAQHIQQTRAEGFPDYDIFPAGSGPEHAVIHFIEPFLGDNLRAFGYDMFSEPLRRAAIQRARDSGTSVISNKVTLIQDSDPNSAGILMFLPVYAIGGPTSTAMERRAATRGFVYGAFRMDDLMSGILRTKRAHPLADFDIEIFDGPQASHDGLLYDDDKVLNTMDSNFEPLFRQSSTFSVLGHVWTVNFFTRKPFEAMIDTQKPLIVLSLGVLLSILLYAYITLRKKIEDDLRRFSESLEARINERTLQLELANKELEAFSYSIAHDLRTPLRALSSFSQVLAQDYSARLDDTACDYLNRMQAASLRMGQLIDDLLKLSRVSRTELQPVKVDLSELAKKVHTALQLAEPDRPVIFTTIATAPVTGDPKLLEIAFENLLSNALKFTRKTTQPKIEFGKTELDSETVFYIRDNGVGFDMSYINKLFKPFERLHTESEFEGTGIGLSIVSRIITRHGGRVWAQAEVGKGATFYFTLPN